MFQGYETLPCRRAPPDKEFFGGQTRLAGPSSILAGAEEGTTVAGRRRPIVRERKGATEVPKEAPLEVSGTITQVFPSTTFAVELENGHTVLAHIAGRLRRHRIRILPGDRVELEMSPYDLTKARIVYRYRAGEARRQQ